jgi:hypothetical protein
MPVSRHAVRLHALIRRGRRVDDDNMWGALAPVRDALCNSRKDPAGWGVTPDDTPQWVKIGSLEQEIGPQWTGKEEVLLVLEKRKRTMTEALDSCLRAPNGVQVAATNDGLWLAVRTKSGAVSLRYRGTKPRWAGVEELHGQELDWQPL